MHGNTAGLRGSNQAIIHHNQSDNIIAFHRWDNGDRNDDTIVIVNFGNKQFDQYDLTFPRDGTWRVRFNSTWEGYSPDFKESPLADITPKGNRIGTVPMAPYAVYVLSQD